MESLLERIRARGAFTDRAEAGDALLAVLESVAPMLDAATRDMLADELPEAWSVPVADVPIPQEPDRDALVRTVANHERTSLGFGIEHAMAVCQALSEHASSDLRPRLESLGGGLGELFVPHAETEAGPERMASPHDRQGGRESLAGGRTGSHHPLSEAHPGQGQRHSVAATDDPHADSRLSSAQGVTQERQGRTLSEGKPGSDHPVSEDD